MSAFDDLMDGLPSAMLIVTTVAGGERAGCLVGFSTQASIDPPRFLVCLSTANHTYRVALRASRLAVHVVPEDRLDLAELFGGQTDDRGDKFAEAEWWDGPHGLPIVAGCESWLTGLILDRHDLGDHVGHLLEPETVHVGSQRPLGNAQAARIDPGHAP